MITGTPNTSRSDEVGRMTSALGVSAFLALATFAGWLSIPHGSGLQSSVLVVIWLNITITLIALGFEVARRPYSLHAMHLFAMYLFLGAASLFQYSRGYLGVAGPIGPLADYILPAALATTCWYMGYLPAYEMRRILGRPPVGAFLNRQLTPTRVILFGLLATVGLAYLVAAGMLGAVTRASAERALEEFSLQSGAGQYTSSLYILSSNVVRGLPSMALLAAILLVRRDRQGRSPLLWGILAIVGLGTLLVNNPFAAARMLFSCSLVAFAAPFLMIRFKTSWMLLGSIAIGLAILPALGESRNALEFDALLEYMQLVSPVEYLSRNSDVDSLGMTALIEKWLDRNGHTWGRQISGAFLSFIPRALWPTKPIGTGAMVTGDLGFEFTNLSPPINSEALIDFGLPGTIVFGALFGFILARIDMIYWSAGREKIARGDRVIDVLYPFLLVCTTFYTRGDLFAANTFAASFVFWIIPLGIALPLRRRTDVAGIAVQAAQSP